MKNHLPFYNFLKYKPKIFKQYFIALCHINTDINKIELLITIFDMFTKERNIITFKELYKLDFAWYKYYYQSANPKGKLINGEKRFGVNRNVVNDIMKIKRLINTDLDHSINIYCSLLAISHKN